MVKAKTTGSMVMGTMNLSAVVRSKKKMLTLSPRRKGAARKIRNWIDVTNRAKRRLLLLPTPEPSGNVLPAARPRV